MMVVCSSLGASHTGLSCISVCCYVCDRLFLLSYILCCFFFFFFSSRRRHTRSLCDWSSDVCSSDLKQLGRVQPPERLLRDEQRLPNHRGRVLHLLEAFGRGRPQPDRREGRLHRVRRPEMLPVLTRELVKRHHPFPVAIERAPDLGVAALGAPRLKRALLPVGVFARLRVRDLRE